MRAVAACAAWRAECEYDASRGVPFGAFARQRVLSGALTHYRREWAFARRGGSDLDCSDLESTAYDPKHFSSASAAVRTVVAHLPAPERRLIKQLFWNELTERQIARQAGVTQQAISKRKRVILEDLRHLLDDVPRAIPVGTPAATSD